MKHMTLFIILSLSLTLGCGGKDYKKMLAKAGKHRLKALEQHKKGKKWYKKSFANYKKAYQMDMSVFRQNDYYILGDMYAQLDKNKRKQEFMHKQAISAPKH